MQKLVLRLLLVGVCALGPSVKAEAGACPDNPDALCISRVIEIDTRGGPQFGTYQYAATLDLKPKEVVLTFDDGPNPKNTPKMESVNLAYSQIAWRMISGGKRWRLNDIGLIR